MMAFFDIKRETRNGKRVSQTQSGSAGASLSSCIRFCRRVRWRVRLLPNRHHENCVKSPVTTFSWGDGLSVLCRHLLCASLLILVVGCGREGAPPESAESVRTEDMSLGEIHLEFRIEPDQVRYDSDTVLTIAVDVPSQFDIDLPSLHDRVQGFSLQGTYSTDVIESQGRKQWEVRARLTPNVSETHRIAPMAVKITDRGHSPPQPSWLPTRAIDLEVAPLVEEVPDSVQTELAPVWIAPSFWTVASWVGALLLVVALGYLVFRLTRRLHKEAVLRRLSPRERAMRELEELLRKHLVENDQVKDFYVELTMIVRRYIERAHGVRAPEQTTEEFLLAVQDDARFDATVVTRLRTFLEAADLVKFAAYHPDEANVDAATRTAREYVEADAKECERADVEKVEEAT